MVFLPILFLVLLPTWILSACSGALITTSANPEVFTFKGDIWRNWTLSRREIQVKQHVLPISDIMHADMIIDCRFIPESKMGALVKILDKWVLFAARQWYLFPHTIWKRIITGNTKDELMEAGCDVVMDARAGLAEANFEWSHAMDEFWIELPILRAKEKLMIRGGGHIATWIDESNYQHSFQWKSFDDSETVGQVNLACRALVLNYHTDETLAKLLFRTDEEAFYWPYFPFNVSYFTEKTFFYSWETLMEAKHHELRANMCLVDDDLQENEEELQFGETFQPLTFLSSQWPALQMYLHEVYHCSDVHFQMVIDSIHWVSIHEWDVTIRRKAKELIQQFPFLSL